MDRNSTLKWQQWAGIALWLAGAGCNSSHTGGPSPAPTSAAQTAQALPLVAECAAGSAAGSGWECSAPASITCDDADDLTPIRVQSPSGTTCDTDDLRITETRAAGSNVRTIRVSDRAGATLCTTQLEVIDDTPPVLETHTIALWPPNHKFHDIAVEDCVTAVDACDGTLRGEFIWASSDEPIDDIGDGHHSPDIGVSADGRHACVRSERQGPKDGRVYKLGVRVVDGNGNATEGVCAVIVDHDQRGVIGADSGEKYRVTFDDDSDAGLAACAGDPDEPPTTPPPPPTTPPPPPPPPGDDDNPDGGPGPG
ncbi:MAG TPA: hypothetical protein VFG30_18345 [Polyangiales bacterium]|nr:hypothetical protein [Polyangiales bacterium]